MNVSQTNLVDWAQATLFVPLLLGFIGFVAFVYCRHSQRISQWLGWTTVVVSGFLLLLSVLMLLAPANLYPIRFSLPLPIITVDFHIDALSLYFVLLVNVVAFVASWNSIPYLENRFSTEWPQHPTFFHASVNLFHFTMLLVPMLDNLIGLWIAIELTTLFSAFLVAHQDKRDSWEAAWKYLIITSTGIILALLGTMFLANAVPNRENLGELLGSRLPDSIMDWTFLMELARNGQLTEDFVKLSFLFILAGYGTKAGFAPMHTWLPDGHGEAPAPISALLSGVLLKSALYAILRFYTITNTVLRDDTFFTSTILLGSGLFSLLLATPFILKDNRFKRVLAYHSLEHMGIITFGIGIGGPVALFGALFHALNHAITKSLMFLSWGNIMRQYEQAVPQDETLPQEEITGVLRSMPWTGAVLVVGGLALVGTPPFNIFMSEFIILWGTFTRFWGPSAETVLLIPRPVIVTALILFMLSTTLIYYGLVRHLARLVLNKGPVEHKLEEKFLRDLFPLFLLLGLVVLFGFWVIPALSDLISNSVNVVLNRG